MNLCLICVHLWRPSFGNACYDDPEILSRLYSDLCRDRSNRTSRDIYGPRERRFAGAAETAGVAGNLHSFLRCYRICLSRADYFRCSGNYRRRLSSRRWSYSTGFGRIVPLGMPLIAGPALLTALLVLVDTVGVVFTLVSLLVNLALVALAFWNADRFARWMGMQGLHGVSKIVALLLAAIAVSLIRRGWQAP